VTCSFVNSAMNLIVKIRGALLVKITQFKQIIRQMDKDWFKRRNMVGK